MITKNNCVNTNFQILYFLVGSCHTVDAAYALLCNLKDDRVMALAQLEPGKLKKKASELKFQAIIDNPESKEYEVLEAQAELLTINANQDIVQKNIDGAQQELDFIEQCMARLEPHRKFAHLPLAEAHQASQQEEWRLELARKAENFLLTSGSIPADEFNTMRMHPDFKEIIAPAIENIRAQMAQGLSLTKLSLLESPVPQLLALTE